MLMNVAGRRVPFNPHLVSMPGIIRLSRRIGLRTIGGSAARGVKVKIPIQRVPIYSSGPASANGTASPLGLTLPVAPTKGNMLIACIGIFYGTVSSIVTSGVTWTKAINYYNINYYADTEIWYGLVGPGASTSVGIAGSISFWGAIAFVCEYSGLSNNPLDQTAYDFSQLTNPADTGQTPMTTAANELLIGTICVAQTDSPLTNPTGGFTLYNASCPSSVEGLAAGYLENIVNSKGQYICYCTQPDAWHWSGVIATFKGAT